MGYLLNVDNQVTVPEEICKHMGIEPGDEVDYEILTDGSVRMFKVTRKTEDKPCKK